MLILDKAQENHKKFENSKFYVEFTEKLIADIRLILKKKGVEETKEELAKIVGFTFLYKELKEVDSRVLKFPAMTYEKFISYFGFYLGFLRSEIGLKTKS